MRRRLVAGVLAWLAATAPAADGRPRLALVVTETAGFRHDSIEAAKTLLRELDRDASRYHVRFLGGARELSAGRLARAHGVVFLNTSGELPLRRRQKANLLAFVRSGKGFLGTHSASDTFHTWPEYIRLLGGEFEAHPFVGDGRVVVEDPSHPATRRLPASFLLREEFYFFRADPRCCAHVLARLDVSSFGGSAAEDRPLVWCRREGRGRVFYDALGHFSDTWRDERQRSMLAGGLVWILGLERRVPCR